MDAQQFLLSMQQLAITMNEDVDEVTERFKVLMRNAPTSWKVTYLFARGRAAQGIRDPWFYDPPIIS